MSRLSFADFFHKATGNLPYAYQARLAGNDSGTPCHSQLINIPTGLGKTAAVVMAGPATYEIDGEQYIAVSVGYGGSNAVIGGRYPRRPGRLHVYKLGGTAKAPEYAPFAQNPPLDMTQVTTSNGNATHGGQLVEQWCLSCHIGGIYIPDLARSPRLTTPGLFRQVVLDGELRPRGMASFAQWLNEGDAEDIRAYLLEQAAKVK